MADLPVPELRTDRAFWYWRALHIQNALRYGLLMSMLVITAGA